MRDDREIAGPPGDLDEEILDAMRLAARLGGVFGEPAGVAGLAGLRRALREGVV